MFGPRVLCVCEFRSGCSGGVGLIGYLEGVVVVVVVGLVVERDVENQECIET